jgi:hypothetical protein
MVIQQMEAMKASFPNMPEAIKQIDDQIAQIKAMFPGKL